MRSRRVRVPRRDRSTRPFAVKRSSFYRLVVMKELSERDAHRALNIVAAAGASGTGTTFGLETVDAIAEAIPADDVAYVEWRFGDRNAVRVAHDRQEPIWLGDALAATCDSYPLRDVDHAGSPEPLRIMIAGCGPSPR